MATPRVRIPEEALKVFEGEADRQGISLQDYFMVLAHEVGSVEAKASGPVPLESKDILDRLEALERRVRDLEGSKASGEPEKEPEGPVEGLGGGEDDLGDVLDELEGLEL